MLTLSGAVLVHTHVLQWKKATVNGHNSCHENYFSRSLWELNAGSLDPRGLKYTWENGLRFKTEEAFMRNAPWEPLPGQPRGNYISPRIHVKSHSFKDKSAAESVFVHFLPSNLSLHVCLWMSTQMTWSVLHHSNRRLVHGRFTNHLFFPWDTDLL